MQEFVIIIIKFPPLYLIRKGASENTVVFILLFHSINE